MKTAILECLVAVMVVVGIVWQVVLDDLPQATHSLALACFLKLIVLQIEARASRSSDGTGGRG